MAQTQTHYASYKKRLDRTPPKPNPSKAKLLKAAHRKAKSTLPLKVWLRKNSEPELVEATKLWLANKRANFSKPQEAIGRTRGRVKRGGSKAPDKNLSGK